jgi:glucose-1-phosphate adenylyltransferase
MNADCTIAVIDVPLKEASRFGIMSTEEDGKIYKFSEKPKNPDSTKASMGIYIFSKDVLFRYLNEDAQDPESSNDFGKNIIPAMLAANERMYAYPFSGYWKDVGTISSLWEANMDLLGETPSLDLHDEEWRIYSRHEAHAPQFVGADAVVDNSSITEGCEIYGTVCNSVLGAGVCVKAGAIVSNSVIMDNVTVETGAKINFSIVDEETTVGAYASIGAEQKKAKGITVIAAGLDIPERAVIGDNEMISDIAQIQTKEDM